MDYFGFGTIVQDRLNIFKGFRLDLGAALRFVWSNVGTSRRVTSKSSVGNFGIHLLILQFFFLFATARQERTLFKNADEILERLSGDPNPITESERGFHRLYCGARSFNFEYGNSSGRLIRIVMIILACAIYRTLIFMVVLVIRDRRSRSCIWHR